MTFSVLTAYERTERILDPGTFEPLTTSSTSTVLVAGGGLIGGKPVAVALIDGHVHGGTIGVDEAGILLQLTDRLLAQVAKNEHPAALIIGFDTGGVRVEEGPRALAAASGVGVTLARLSLLGVPLAAIISGPRGCFGATAVMAALPDHIVMTADAHWGLTGPRLLGSSPEAFEAALRATAAEARLANGDAHAMVPDDAAAIRVQLVEFVGRADRVRRRRLVGERIAESVDTLHGLRARLLATVDARPSYAEEQPRRRERDLLRYSFRGEWRPSGVIRREGLVHAATGTLGDRPALSLIVGPEGAPGRGIGIIEAAVLAEMLQKVTSAAASERAAILTFLFCQGHVVDLEQERFGLPRALAACLRTMVGARLLGHPIVSVLGGGTYGAAYLALAAPSHRILAMRGTSVAPMAPQVLQAFQALRGQKPGHEAQALVADRIPDIRIVESAIRLPRILREEFLRLMETVRPEVSAA